MKARLYSKEKYKYSKYLYLLFLVVYKYISTYILYYKYIKYYKYFLVVYKYVSKYISTFPLNTNELSYLSNFHSSDRQTDSLEAQWLTENPQAYWGPTLAKGPRTH